MGDVTRILAGIEHGDTAATERLLPLVYDELRKLAAVKLANERPGQTLQATALVHEAYLQLVDVAHAQHWTFAGISLGRRQRQLRKCFQIACHFSAKQRKYLLYGRRNGRSAHTG